jgi:hypothetical protein
MAVLRVGITEAAGCVAVGLGLSVCSAVFTRDCSTAWKLWLAPWNSAALDLVTHMSLHAMNQSPRYTCQQPQAVLPEIPAIILLPSQANAIKTMLLSSYTSLRRKTLCSRCFRSRRPCPTAACHLHQNLLPTLAVLPLPILAGKPEVWRVLGLHCVGDIAAALSAKRASSTPVDAFQMPAQAPSAAKDNRDLWL